MTSTLRRRAAHTTGLVVSLLLLTATAARADPGAGWWWPLEPRPTVARAFEAPSSDYGPGHRGVDLVGPAGATVRSVAAGTVVFAGAVAGQPVVSVSNDDGERATYQPVSALVVVGQHVATGQPLGRLLLVGSHCAPGACLHLGRRVGSRYADPMQRLGARSDVRLVSPTGPPPSPPQPSYDGPAGSLRAPVVGPISSPFGMRVHPITGIFKLHDGTDFAAPCGTAVRAAAAGTVTAQYFDPAYGNRVVVTHGAVGSGLLSTTYNHLADATVHLGELVTAGQVVGRVGATGYATGCHLHFMVLIGSHPTDPTRWLP